MKAKEVWDQIFDLKVGDRVRLSSSDPRFPLIAADLENRRGKIIKIDGDFATVELDHVPQYTGGVYAYWRKQVTLLLKDLKRVRKC